MTVAVAILAWTIIGASSLAVLVAVYAAVAWMCRPPTDLSTGWS